MGNLVKFVSKDGLEKLEPWVDCRVAIRRCADGAERAYRLTRHDGKLRELPVYVEECETKDPLSLLSVPACEECGPMREDRDRLIAELAKEREQARAAREQTISYAEQKTADWKGIADVLNVKLDDSAQRVAWLERELKLEKAKSARKNRI